MRALFLSLVCGCVSVGFAVPSSYRRAGLRAEDPFMGASARGDAAAPAVRGFFGTAAEPMASLHGSASGRTAWVRAGDAFEGWSVVRVLPESGCVELMSAGVPRRIVLPQEGVADPRAARLSPGGTRGRFSSAPGAVAAATTAFDGGERAPAARRYAGARGAADAAEGAASADETGFAGLRAGVRSDAASSSRALVSAGESGPSSGDSAGAGGSDESAPAAEVAAFAEVASASQVPAIAEPAAGESDGYGFPLLSRAHLEDGVNLALAARDARRRYLRLSGK